MSPEEIVSNIQWTCFLLAALILCIHGGLGGKWPKPWMDKATDKLFVASIILWILCLFVRIWL